MTNDQGLMTKDADRFNRRMIEVRIGVVSSAFQRGQRGAVADESKRCGGLSFDFRAFIRSEQGDQHRHSLSGGAAIDAQRARGVCANEIGFVGERAREWRDGRRIGIFCERYRRRATDFGVLICERPNERRRDLLPAESAERVSRCLADKGQFILCEPRRDEGNRVGICDQAESPDSDGANLR